jgi:hypothetical protein
VRGGRLKQVAAWSAFIARSLPPPPTPWHLAARHAMLHHLFDLGRDDVRVSFWAGRREFRGMEPPARLLRWGRVRRVREERWRTPVVTEAVGDPLQRSVLVALLAASPLTDLLEPLRPEPALELGDAARWLREPTVARAVADRWLRLGLPQVGGILAGALITLYNQKERALESRTWSAFLSHLHLLALIGRRDEPAAQVQEMNALCQAQPGLRDFYGMFAAAQRVGVGRPADVARDPRLDRLIDAYAAACVQVCGATRVLELEGVMARGVRQLALSAP